LEVVGGLARRMLDRAGYGGGLLQTGDLDAAIDGASFVLFQIRVGGQAARLHDETVPLHCGCIGQETTGAGGFAKAMRTVPVMLEIADRVGELAAPGAWIVDFTNPVGIVTRALLDHGHRAIGLCNVAIGFQRELAAQRTGVPRAQTVAEIERDLLQMYRDPSLTEKPALLDKRGGAYYSEAAVGLVASLVSGNGGVHVVDTRNNGTLAGLADDDVVEVPAQVGVDGPAPLPQEPLAPELLGLAQHVAAYERLAVEAATTRDAVAA